MLTYCVNDTKLSARLYQYLNDRFSKLNGAFDKAIQVEHEVQQILEVDVKEGGYSYDKAKADYLRLRLKERVEELDKLIVASFPPRAYNRGEYIPRLTRFGTISRSNLRWWEGTDFSHFTPDAAFCRLGYEYFNPGSVKQIVQRLTDNGWWDPVDRTDGYIEAQRTRNREKVARLEKYGWKLNEQNLGTLTPEAPEGARYLVERLALNSRLTMLDSWEKECRIKIKINEENITRIGQLYTDKSLGSGANTNIKNILQTTIKLIKNELGYAERLENMDSLKNSIAQLLHFEMVPAISVESIRNSISITATPLELFVEFYAPDATHILHGLKSTVLGSFSTSTINGTIDTIGTWTHRCAHRNPNLANIATAKTIKYKEPTLARTIIGLGACTRSLFHSGGHWQVGCDADGIQLRLFAHFANDQDLIDANVSGNKEIGTDIHSLNRRALGSVCLTRDDAKTWIYAFLLGAGDAKLAAILKCTLREGKEAKANLLSTYKSIKELRTKIIPKDAARGYFIGVDGRLVCCDSEHLMLAGYLQEGESTTMKYSIVEAKKRIERAGIRARMLTFVHDEVQYQVKGTREEAEYVGKVQAESIRWAGEQLGVVCPLKGNYVVGKNWWQTH
jgi:hypothetical protein